VRRCPHAGRSSRAIPTGQVAVVAPQSPQRPIWRPRRDRPDRRAPPGPQSASFRHAPHAAQVAAPAGKTGVPCLPVPAVGCIERGHDGSFGPADHRLASRSGSARRPREPAASAQPRQAYLWSSRPPCSLATAVRCPFGAATWNADGNRPIALPSAPDTPQPSTARPPAGGRATPVVEPTRVGPSGRCRGCRSMRSGHLGMVRLCFYIIVTSGGGELNFSENPGRRDGLGPRNPHNPVVGHERRRREILLLRRDARNKLEAGSDSPPPPRRTEKARS
jgi:hypothetical protein